jgi:chemotaxis protein CheX
MQDIDQDFLIHAILESTSAVFVTMLEADLEAGPPSTETGDADAGVVSLVGLTGPWTGTGSFCCSPTVAGRISSKMFMTDPPIEGAAITDEVMDAVAEITNMIVGNIKHLLEERVGPMAINIPTVVYGRNFAYRSITGATGLSIPFTWESDIIQVQLCIAPDKGNYSRTRQEMALHTA